MREEIGILKSSGGRARIDRMEIPFSLSAVGNKLEIFELAWSCHTVGRNRQGGRAEGQIEEEESTAKRESKVKGGTREKEVVTWGRSVYSIYQGEAD